MDPSQSAASFRIFLEKIPPGQVRVVSETTDRNSLMIETPEIQLHCDSPECGGIRFFDHIGGRPSLQLGRWTHTFLDYKCRHCQRTTKTYALTVRMRSVGGISDAIKFGEWPVFAPYVPARLLSLVGDDQELFRKGRQSESHGLGIAAFAYYRRVVENQKTRLIEEIIKVAKRVGSKAAIINTLSEAAAETRFSAAVEKMKDAIPEVLRVNGHNPLTLLHSLLSDGLHAQTDEECLAFATDIRVLLSDMCERISTALKDQTEVETALSRLLARQSSRKTAHGDKSIINANRKETANGPDSPTQAR
jgi:hypothetical protein